MKKFISALTSLAIATTALGGTIVMSADAADSTIIEFRSGKENTIKAKAGDTIPVSVYVPQSSGAHTFSLKMSINGTETLGVGVDETADELALIKAEAEKTKDEAAAKDYLAVEHWLYGNYGITTANEAFAKPYCFDSGVYQDGWGGGDAELSMAFFKPNTWNISLTMSSFISNDSNADAYAPYKEALGDGDPDDFDYSGYTPVTTWSKDVAWAYDYAMATFDLVLPADLKDGTYTLDVLREKYINVVSHQWASSTVSGKDGKVEFETVPLKIVVGEGGGDTTTAPAAETTAPAAETTAPAAETTKTVTTGGSTNVDKPAPAAGTVQYDLIPNGKDYSFDGTNNVVTVEPGSELKVDWVVSNDPGTAGMQMHFDFGGLTFTKRTAGKAYKAPVQWNDETFAYVFGQDQTLTAADGAVVSSFTFTVPEKEGTYKLGLKDGDEPNLVRPLLDEDPDIPFNFYGLTVNVGKGGGDNTTAPAGETTAPAGETTAPAAETTQPAANVDKPAPAEGTAQYDLIPNGLDYGFNGKNNTVTVKPGSELKVDWTVKNDPGIAGMQMHFDFSDLTFTKRTAGKAYKAPVQWNDATFAYVFGQDQTLTAADGAVISSFTFTVPEKEGTYVLGLKDGDEPNLVRPLLDEDPDVPYVFYGLAVTVAKDGTGETTAPAGETTAPAGETTAPAGETTAPAGETTAPIGSVLYGDVNVDGKVRINDVVLLNKHISQGAALSDQGAANADCVKDGKLDEADSKAIKQFLAKLIKQEDLGK